MDPRKLVKRQNNNIGEAEDRISELPDSLLHYILSFIDTKCVARTCVLSQRWYHIWNSIPILEFPSWNYPKPSLSEMTKFMDFLDRTLLLRDASSNIQTFSLNTHQHMNASQVHSWISNITTGNNVENLDLYFDLGKPFFVPSSLFKCESLTKLNLSASCAIHIPKSFSFPKLKSLTLYGIQFRDDCWNEQHFSDCPVLEELNLEDCTWSGVRKFCIFSPALKVLNIWNQSFEEDYGIQNCHLKIHAPSLISLTYAGYAAKDCDLPSFVTLNDAHVFFDSRREHRNAAVSKFLRALSHVKSLTIDVAVLEVLSDVDNLINNLPAFHNLNGLNFYGEPTSDKLIFALIKAAPNLKELHFDICTLGPIDEDEKEYGGETEGLCRHLESVHFCAFHGEWKEMRWAALILKNAESLKTMIISYSSFVENKEVVTSELSSLPRASGRNVFNFR